MLASRISLLVVGLLLGMLTTTTVSAQTGEDALRFAQRFPGTGPSMTGLGGASIAGVSDYAALFTNPAGLGLTQESMLSGSLTGINTLNDGLYQASGFQNTLRADVNKTRLGHFATVYKFPTSRGSLVLGAAYNQTNAFERVLAFDGENGANSITDFFMPVPGEFTLENQDGTVIPNFNRALSFIAFETFGIDFDQDLYDQGDAVPFLPAVTRGTVRQTGTVREGGMMQEFNFGGSVEAFKNVLVGLSINIPFGTYRFNRTLEEDDFLDDNDGTGGTTDFQFLRFNEQIRSSIVGVNVRGGATYSVSPAVRLGLMVETPTSLSIEEDFDTVLETAFDNGDTFSYGSGSDEDEGRGFFKYRVTTPWRLGGGLALNSDDFTLTIDAEVVDWKQIRLHSSTIFFDDENALIRETLTTVVNGRLGLMYVIGPVVLRGGAAVEPDPRIGDAALGADGSKLDRTKTYFSAGAGFRFARQFQVDFGWMQERFKDEYLPYVEVQNAPYVQEQVIRNRFSLGLRMFFQ